MTRLLKYIRGIQGTFSCPSVLLTTLLGERIRWLDKESASFADTPSALQIILGRLDNYLQAHLTRPAVPNSSQRSEDLGALLSDTATRTSAHGKYRARVKNTGLAAPSINYGRGDFYLADRGTRRWETLRYCGVHFVEAFLIRRSGEPLVGRSAPFDVVVG